MGKIRVRTFGEGEKEQEEKRKRQREEKKTRESLTTAEKGETTEAAVPVAEAEPEKKKKSKKTVTRMKSKKFVANLGKVQRNTLYPLAKAIELLRGFDKAKFDETVELHINVKEKGLSGQMVLPHGTGKKLRIKVADDALIESIANGVIDFDILIAQPQLMPKLGKVARILGPRGLMPNVKNGTITPKPEDVIKKLSSGQVNFKSEASAPIVHLSVGKLSFADKQLVENIESVMKAIGPANIVSLTLKSTMSPGIKVQTA